MEGAGWMGSRGVLRASDRRWLCSEVSGCFIEVSEERIGEAETASTGGFWEKCYCAGKQDEVWGPGEVFLVAFVSCGDT